MACKAENICDLVPLKKIAIPWSKPHSSPDGAGGLKGGPPSFFTDLVSVSYLPLVVSPVPTLLAFKHSL